MLASRYGRTEIVKYLIEAKATLDLQMQVYRAQNPYDNDDGDDDILYIKFWWWLIVVYRPIYS